MLQLELERDLALGAPDETALENFSSASSASSVAARMRASSPRP